MCGIWGVYNIRSQQAVDPGQLARMGRPLIHRGPDEAGSYIQGPVGLGIHRLRIIDLKSGQQPITSEDRSFVTVFNGEIYNHRELRESLIQKGHHFKSKSDTEVIVHLYEESGPACLDRLDGIFAIAVWDVKRRQLFLARDPLGVKPLYYSAEGGRILFGSELKALLAFSGAAEGVDFSSLSDYLSIGYIPGTRTIFQNIRQLPAGHYLLAGEAGVDVQRYWDVQFTSRTGGSPDDTARELLALTRSAVKRQMISDVPLGALLSGGIDSSVVVALLSQEAARPIKTFSVAFAEKTYDESQFARQVSRLYGTQHYEVVCDPRECAAVLPKLPYYADGLFSDPALLPTFLVAQAARREVTVVLSGDGGDELFAGYPTYQADAILGWYRRLPAWVRGPIAAAVGAMPPSSRKLNFSYMAKKFVEGSSYSKERAHYSWRTFFDDEEKAKLVPPELFRGRADNGAFAVFTEYFNRAKGWRAPLDQFQYVDIKTWLADDVLVKVDRMSMANSLEVRVPLLDRALVEFAAAIPASQRMRALQTKHLFKKMAAPLLPPGIIHRKKAGFLPALSIWFCREWKELLGDTLSEASLRQIGWLNAGYVQQLLTEHWSGKRDHAFRLWNLLILCWWHRAFLASERGHDSVVGQSQLTAL